ncbi:MAG: Ig-like domain-containing protein [Erysipelotrichaceae bacterium]|nr:Ig-like domain-containing protein [Erysipelotrichaceae bacterium]
MKKISISILLILCLCACGAKVEDVQFKSKTIALGAGDEQAFEYTVSPEGANESSVKFVSSDENVAIVKNKKVIGVDNGECTISAVVNNETLSSFDVEVHVHEWENIVQIVHHEEKGHFKEWDEVIVDKAAWDEVIVDKEGYDETVLVRAAYDETVVVSEAYDETIVDQAAWDEIIIDQPYIAPTVVNKYECNRCGMQYGADMDMQKCRNASGQCGGTVVHRSWTEGGQEEVSHTVHHDAITHTVHHDRVTKVVHHDDEYKTIHHDAVTHTVHHDAVTHTVNHDAIYNKEDFNKGNKDYWVVDEKAWDEEVIIGYKCKVCHSVKDEPDGLKYISEQSK